MPYTAEKPRLPRPVSELRQTIPGWGVDLDPADRPSFPKEVDARGTTGAHWDFPERQQEHQPRERSLEHLQLPPVFGTAVPLRGLSGMIRRYAYGHISEGPVMHWLLLMAADRVDVMESRVEGLLRGKPDNPLTETGIKAEITHHGLSSRLGKHRADVKHHPLDVLVVAAPWLIGGLLLYGVTRRSGTQT